MPQCPMSLYHLGQCQCRQGSCHPVEFKEWPFRAVDFRGLGPYREGWAGGVGKVVGVSISYVASIDDHSVIIQA